MAGAVTSAVELTCLQGLADLERIEGALLGVLTQPDPESAATMLRLMLAHLMVQSDRLNKAMVLDRLDAWGRATA